MSRLKKLIERGEALIQDARWEPTWDEAIVPEGQFRGWVAQVETALHSILDADHPYRAAMHDVGQHTSVEMVSGGIAVLQGLAEDIEEGYLRDVRSFIAADVFTDFLDMAEHLLGEGYKDAAAMLCGAVLEDGLRRISQTRELDVPGQGTIGTVNQELLKAGVYNRLRFKQVDTWKELRDDAMHGDFDNYSDADVRAMLSGLRQFLAEYLS